MNPALIALLIQEMPDIIKGIRELFRKNNPDDPQPTESEILAAFREAVAQTLAKDEAWLATHPKDES